MATTIFFNGRLISVPGSYSEIDASGLEQVGLGANGIVAIIGEAQGGRPVSAIDNPADLLRLTRPSAVRKAFRTGDLREACAMAFEPSDDGEIVAGAQEIVALKVNPATQSTGILYNANGPAINLTSVDYGAHTEQINVQVVAGTNKGRSITVNFEDLTEAVDDLGEDSIFRLAYYENDSDGWDTMTAQIGTAKELQAMATRSEAGLDSAITTQLAATGAIQLVSSSAGDNTQTATVYGLTALGAAIKETYDLNGVTPVTKTTQFNKVYGVKLSAACAGIVTVDPVGGGANVIDVPAGDLTAGMVLGVAQFVAGVAPSLAADGATTGVVLVEGRNTLGALVLEKVTLNGTSTVNMSGLFQKITGIVLGNVAAARTVTMSAKAMETTPSVHNTVQKVADFANARQEIDGGFFFDLQTPVVSLPMANLDTTLVAADCYNSYENFYADLYAVANWFNTSSQFVRATVDDYATSGLLDEMSLPAFLSGGGEGTTVFSDWQKAFSLLKQIKVNSIVVLTANPVVHAELESHIAYMCGIGRKECDGFVGLMDSGMTGLASLSEIRSQIVNLNSRHLRAFAQSVERFDTAGERTVFPPYFTAVLAAAMQAGSPVGTSLTYKYPKILAFAQHSTWDPAEDAEELIQTGLVFLEEIPNNGRRWVRNVTTYLRSNNLAFSEGSVNEAANYAVYEFRTAMEANVGQRNFAGTVNAARMTAIGKLGLLVDEGVLNAYRSLQIDKAADVLELAVEMAPVIPFNFIQNTIHLVTA